MMKLIDDVYRLFKPAEAEASAKLLKDGDPDWNYVVVHDPKGTGYSFINIFDEDGVFVGRVK